jgi:hypothetical protein
MEKLSVSGIEFVSKQSGHLLIKKGKKGLFKLAWVLYRRIEEFPGVEKTANYLKSIGKTKFEIDFIVGTDVVAILEPKQ